MKSTLINDITCNSVKEKLFPLYERALPESMVNTMDAHIASCKECQRTYVLFQQSLDEIQHDRQVPDSPFFITRLLAKQEHAAAIVPPPISPLHFPVLRPILLSLGILASLLAGILIGNSTQKKLTGNYREHTSRIEAMKIYADEALVSEVAENQTDKLLVLK
jgi:hypothetical protein